MGERVGGLGSEPYDYVAPGPLYPTIRTDVLAVGRLLVDLAPTDRRGPGLRVLDAQTRDTLSALHGACEVMGQVARMNRATFSMLSRSEQIHVPTRLLAGDILSEDPAAASAGSARDVAHTGG